MELVIILLASLPLTLSLICAPNVFSDAISMPWCPLLPDLFSLSRLHWTNILFLLYPLVYGSFLCLWPMVLFSPPSVLLMKSKALLTNFQIFLPFESSCIQFLTSYLEESTTTSFVKGIWIKFKVSATDSDSPTANTTDYSKSAQFILGCHTDWFQDKFVFVLCSCHCWCLAVTGDQESSWHNCHYLICDLLSVAYFVVSST